MIGRATRRRRLNALKTKRPKIKLFDESFDHPNRVILSHIIVE
jgi:hypothetical protein